MLTRRFLLAQRACTSKPPKTDYKKLLKEIKKEASQMKTVQVDGEVVPDESFMSKLKNAGGSNQPLNIALENERGIPNYNPEMAFKEIPTMMPHVKRHFKKTIPRELKETFGGFDMLNRHRRRHFEETFEHNELRVEMMFRTEEEMEIWKTGCDSDWQAGFSSVELERTAAGTALFQGQITGEVPRDGKHERAGWASMKWMDLNAFNRRRRPFGDWRNYTHLVIKCRGDGRQYKVMLHAPHYIDLTWGDSWSYALHTHGGPYWQYAKIPFSKFFHTVGGRIQDKQKNYFPGEVSSLSFVIMDRIDGPYRLELDWIGVLKDHTHTEKFAYEKYVIPVFNPEGI